jgi:cytochrome c5
MMNPLLLLSAVILFVLNPTPTPGPTPQEPTPAPAAASTNPVKPTPDSQAKAKKLYAIDCLMCHGEKGDGKTDIAKDMQLSLDDWTDPKSLAGKPDQALFDVIRNGKGKMPAEEAGRAKDDVVWNLVIYIRTFSQPGAAPPAGHY